MMLNEQLLKFSYQKKSNFVMVNESMILNEYNPPLSMLSFKSIISEKDGSHIYAFQAVLTLERVVSD